MEHGNGKIMKVVCKDKYLRHTPRLLTISFSSLFFFLCSIEQHDSATNNLNHGLFFPFLHPSIHPPAHPPIHPSLMQVSMLGVEDPRSPAQFSISWFLFPNSCLFHPCLFNKHWSVHVPWVAVTQKWIIAGYFLSRISWSMAVLCKVWSMSSYWPLRGKWLWDGLSINSITNL